MMRISLNEPVSSRYIHINPQTNRVHLLVPVVGGQEISTDNTCKSTVALREFFDGGALEELKIYKKALKADIKLLKLLGISEQREAKEVRLAQIKAYSDAVAAMRYSYPEAMTALLKNPANLYSIQLRPKEQDSLSKVVNPVFNINRKNDVTGMPLSALYNTMHDIFSTLVPAKADPRAILTQKVLASLPGNPQFADIQLILKQQYKRLFGLEEGFMKFPKTLGGPASTVFISAGEEITQSKIDHLMGFAVATSPVTPEDYIHALLGICSVELWEALPTPPFYSVPEMVFVSEKTECFSILTQFFLAILNVYCQAKGISTCNFGTILDASSALSHELVHEVAGAMQKGEEVEEVLCHFFNKNIGKFGLTRSLSEEEIIAVSQKFTRTWRTVTATKENPHMDDFMILDLEAAGEGAKFVTHQGGICVNFAELVDPVAASANGAYFSSITQDFVGHSNEIPHRNESVITEVEINSNILFSFDEKQLEQLPEPVKADFKAHPHYQWRRFLHDVAQGKEEAAEIALKTTPNVQALLNTPGQFTDYSGRVFNCCAYEYAYWAKDTQMCRMLSLYMDESTKADMSARIDDIEHKGLHYQQNGRELCSTHFDLTPLKTALNDYIACTRSANSLLSLFSAAAASWMKVGRAQCDIPAHIAQEYCRPDRGLSFSSQPESFAELFYEPTLTRMLTFQIHTETMECDSTWFSNPGLGTHFAITWAFDLEKPQAVGSIGPMSVAIQTDLHIIDCLDKARTEELAQLREHLMPASSSLTI